MHRNLILSSPITRITTMVMKMRYMCQVLLLSSLSMIAIQASIGSCSLVQRLRLGAEKQEMSMTALLDEYFESDPGNVTSTQVFGISMPKGHVGIISFDAELVDEKGNPMPLHDTYLHHWFIVKYHQNMTSGEMTFQRNSGACTGHYLPHYWGLGADSRKTKSNIPFPYAVEIGSPVNIPKGVEEKWMVNLMAIDVRGAHDKKACTECRCDAFGVPKEYLDQKLGFDMKNLTNSYKGGMFCCEPQFRCKLRKHNPYKKRRMTLKYKVSYVSWDDSLLVPLRVYILDAAEKVVSDGDKVQRICIAEYSVPEKAEGGSAYHIKRTQIPMDKGGYVIYGTAHVHAGAVNTTLYGADGRVICNSTAIEGEGKEAGNEKGFVVGMTVCYPEPGTVKIKTNETVTVEFVYKAKYHTGVMGHFYLYLADYIPNLMNRQEFLYGSDLVASSPFDGQLGLEAIA